MDEIIDGLQAKEFATKEHLEKWLDAHHTNTTGIWLKLAKKDTGVTTVTYAEAVELGLCYGWIDGLVKKYDATYYIQRFTPRRPKSVWSQINTKKVEALIAAGKMKPSGLATVEAAKADGRWDAAYAAQSEMVMPDDFMTALKAQPKALAFFETLTKTGKFYFYYSVQDAKRPETRQRRIEKYVAMLARGEKLY